MKQLGLFIGFLLAGPREPDFGAGARDDYSGAAVGLFSRVRYRGGTLRARNG